MKLLWKSMGSMQMFPAQKQNEGRELQAAFFPQEIWKPHSYTTVLTRFFFHLSLGAEMRQTAEQAVCTAQNEWSSSEMFPPWPMCLHGLTWILWIELPTVVRWLVFWPLKTHRWRHCYLRISHFSLSRSMALAIHFTLEELQDNCICRNSWWVGNIQVDFILISCSFPQFTFSKVLAPISNWAFNDWNSISC